ncbi:hypothetical protein GCM10009734_82120 [Nonomuraea bangladeshensis]
MADKNSDPVVVIGLGRFGSALALELTRRGIEVLAIDNRPKRVQSLAGEITHIATADTTDMGFCASSAYPTPTVPSWRSVATSKRAS